MRCKSVASSKGGVFTLWKERCFLVEIQMSEKTFPRPGRRPNPLKQGPGNFPIKGRRVDVSGFVGHVVSVSTTQLCCCCAEAASE